MYIQWKCYLNIWTKSFLYTNFWWLIKARIHPYAWYVLLKEFYSYQCNATVGNQPAHKFVWWETTQTLLVSTTYACSLPFTLPGGTPTNKWNEAHTTEILISCPNLLFWPMFHIWLLNLNADGSFVGSHEPAGSRGLIGMSCKASLVLCI